MVYTSIYFGKELRNPYRLISYLFKELKQELKVIIIIHSTKAKYNVLLNQTPNIQTNSNCCLQEIMSRLDDIQKLRNIIKIDKKCFKKEITNTPAFRSEIEDLFSKLESNESLRTTKESTNLHLLTKAPPPCTPSHNPSYNPSHPAPRYCTSTSNPRSTSSHFSKSTGKYPPPT